MSFTPEIRCTLLGFGGRLVGLGPRGVIFGDDFGECFGDSIVTVATGVGLIAGFGGIGGVGFGFVIAGLELTG